MILSIDNRHIFGKRIVSALICGKSAFNIDRDRVYLEGFSGGGETGSLVMGMRPDLYTAFLAVSTQWDGNLEALAASRRPVYMAVGEYDSYYVPGL